MNKKHFIEQVHRSMIPLKKRFSVTESGKIQTIQIARLGVGPIDTHNGLFYLYSFLVKDEWLKYEALWKGEIDDQFMPILQNPEHLLIRIDSGCETGQVFNDRTCECKDQLELASRVIANNGEGLIVHIPHQDGRGKGLTLKLATLMLQHELNMDTVESARILAKDDNIDVRTYAGVIGILQFFNINPGIRVSLATNNPRKSSIFIDNGYLLNNLVPVAIKPNSFTHRHLIAKQKHLDHIDLV